MVIMGLCVAKCTVRPVQEYPVNKRRRRRSSLYMHWMK